MSISVHRVDGETGRFPVCNVQSVSLVKATLKARESKRLFVFCILLHPADQLYEENSNNAGHMYSCIGNVFYS